MFALLVLMFELLCRMEKRRGKKSKQLFLVFTDKTVFQFYFLTVWDKNGENKTHTHKKTSITTILQLIVVKILTLREVIGAAGLVIKHRDTDVLEVLSPLCEALTLQTSSPQNQPTLEQTLHEAQARWTNIKSTVSNIYNSINKCRLLMHVKVQIKS